MTNLQYFLSNFPEDLFPTDNTEYYQKVFYGLNQMEKSTCIIAGLARDCDQALVYNLLRAERLGEMFQDYKIIIHENDSIDRTKDILTKASQLNSKIITHTPNNNKIRHPQDRSIERMMDMAYYRSQLQDEIKKYNADYVILYDFDIKGGFSYEGIAHSIAEDKDVIGSNSLIIHKKKWQYYDSFALQVSTPLSDQEKNELNFNRGDELCQVESCFGGLAIYQYDIYCQGQYDSYDCEHICFHESLNTDIYLNPNLVVLYDKTRYCI